MTDMAKLERWYRMLLALYPRDFRERYAEEMVAMMMAGASEGQERPRTREVVNLLCNAIRERLRPARLARPSTAMQDGLALFSLLAPIFLVLVAATMVIFPFNLPPIPGRHILNPAYRQVGGLALLHQPGFAAAAGSLLLVAVAAVIGMRRLTLAATGLAVLCAAAQWYFTAYGYGLPLQLEMLTAGGCLLIVVALVASPGPRRGRELFRWQHALFLIVAAAAVQVSTILVYQNWDLRSWMGHTRAASHPYLVIAAVLGVVAVCLAATFRLNGYFLLMLAGLLYPWVAQVVTTARGGQVLLSYMWIAVPSTLSPLVYLYLPPLLLAFAVAAVRVIQSRHARPAPA